MKRNRKERRSAVVYRLEHVFKGDSPEQPLLVDEQPHYIEGELGNRVIISVPEMTSMVTVERIQDVAEEALGKPVLVVTHNVEFMKAVKLTPQETSKVVKQVEDAKEDERKQIEEARQAAEQRISGIEEGAEVEDDQAAQDIVDLRRELLVESGQAVGGPGGGPGDSEAGDGSDPVGSEDSEGGGGAGGDVEDAEGQGEDGGPAQDS